MMRQIIRPGHAALKPGPMPAADQAGTAAAPGPGRRHRGVLRGFRRMRGEIEGRVPRSPRFSGSPPSPAFPAQPALLPFRIQLRYISFCIEYQLLQPRSEGTTANGIFIWLRIICSISDAKSTFIMNLYPSYLNLVSFSNPFSCPFSPRSFISVIAAECPGARQRPRTLPSAPKSSRSVPKTGSLPRPSRTTSPPESINNELGTKKFLTSYNECLTIFFENKFSFSFKSFESILETVTFLNVNPCNPGVLTSTFKTNSFKLNGYYSFHLSFSYFIFRLSDPYEGEFHDRGGGLGGGLFTLSLSLSAA